jgi:hypothetical protein
MAHLMFECSFFKNDLSGPNAKIGEKITQAEKYKNKNSYAV